LRLPASRFHGRSESVGEAWRRWRAQRWEVVVAEAMVGSRAALEGKDVV
jgi:hypothetical protein